MSLIGLCLGSGPSRGKKLPMASFQIIKKKTHNGTRDTYMAEGESEKCKSKLITFVSKQFALDWEKSTGKKVKLVPIDSNAKAKREAVMKRKKARKEKKKEMEKAKKLKEKEKAKKKK